MKKIVHLGKYWLPFRGGIENVTVSAARTASSNGYDVTVLCFSDSQQAKSYSSHGAKVVKCPVITTVSSQPVGFRYLVSGVRLARSADLVHLHAPNLVAAIVSLFLGKGPKLLVHWHSDVIGKGILGCLIRPLEWLMLRRADVIVCTSQRYASASKSLKGVQSKIEIVPIGVAPPGPALTNTPSDSRLERFIGGHRFILSVGRLVSYKGFDVVISAANSLPEDVKVVIVGEGPLKVDLQRRIKELGLQSKILLTGRLSEGDLDYLYRNASLFCMASTNRAEAFGVVLAEAMSYGVPVVATKIPGSGVPWVNLEFESGLNAECGNPESLGEMCNLILESDEKHDVFSVGAKRRYFQFFSEIASSKKILRVYEYVLSL